MRASYRPAGPARRLAACRVRVLPRLPVHLDGQRELSRVRYLVRRGQPRPEHAVRVGRLAQAPLLGAADRHVEADAVADDAAWSFGRGDVARLLADHHGQLDLVVVPALEVNELHAFARADQRARRLQEHACLVDLAHQVAVVDALVGERLLEVLLVIYGRRDDLARVGDGAEQPHLIDRYRASTPR